MPSITYSINASGQKAGAGGNITYTIGGGSVPAGATIDGIVLDLNLAVRPGGPSVSEVLCNVIDQVNHPGVSTVNRTSSTGPFTAFPTFQSETFGGSTDLFGLSTWTPNSFAAGIGIVLTHNGSSDVLYIESTQQVTVHYTAAPVILPPTYDKNVNNIHITSGNINVTSGNIFI